LAFASAPLDIRIAPHRAEPRAGRVHQHPVEGAREGKRAGRCHLNRVHVLASGLTNRVAEKRDAAGTHVAGPEHARILHGPEENDRLAAGRSAQVERPLTGSGINGEGDELRRFVLNEKEPLPWTAKRVARDDAEAVRREARYLRVDPFGSERGTR